jgi:hypothetical protein
MGEFARHSTIIIGGVINHFHSGLIIYSFFFFQLKTQKKKNMVARDNTDN